VVGGREVYRSADFLARKQLDDSERPDEEKHPGALSSS
jgi:hypothetical protein